MWTWIVTKIKGFRTLFTAGSIFLVGLLNMVGGLDLRPLFSYFVKDEAQVGAIMVVLGIVFAYLRIISTTPVLQSEPVGTEAVPAKLVDEGM
jgi:hypothetical protein